MMKKTIETVSAYSREGYSEESSIQSVSQDGDYIMLGNLKLCKRDLQAALMDSIVVQQPYTPSVCSKFANPGPMGLCAFGITSLTLCCFHAGIGGVEIPNAVLGLAYFYGGIVQLLAGLWEFFVGNTFGCTALTSFGTFWLSWAAISTPAFGIKEAYAADPEQLRTATALFLTGWAIFSFMLTTLTFKSSIAFTSLFAFLTLTFILLAAHDFTGISEVGVAAGIIGIITSFLALYNAFSGVANKQNSYFGAKVIPLNQN
ncbi:hypothetical protein KGF56_004440 [Candida oxycetoniae]|uniref:Ammonia transport outward protein 2 n=1 Tax=Candida oxycetoniae TaxID=497107 RepID=A0AAI9WW36_9ASCO|nr:uncharacterized protein KGF56_004440 [Candida oxycetoniae]KAI3402766.2 hypothetical protein KGF56_004440 [Candida oxycetoniae]